MARLSITDHDGKTLLTTDLPGKKLGKYLKTAANLKSVHAIGALVTKPIGDGGARELALAVEGDVPVGAATELNIAAETRVTVRTHAAGDALLEKTELHDEIVVPNGSAFMSLSLDALLRAGVTGAPGALSFGFRAGTGLHFAYFHPFSVVGTPPTVGDALKAMLAGVVFPADADDLAQVPVGAHVTIAGDGELSFGGTAELGAATAMLATPGLPIVGVAAINRTASVSVGANWTASGEFELRVSRSSDRDVRLAFYRRRGRSLTVSAKASAGVSATLRESDLIAKLMTAISPNPEADVIALVDAGLTDGQIRDLQRAIEASIDRSLTVSAQFELSATRDDEALFAYDVDLSRLDAAGKKAVGEALHGRLTAIGDAAAGGGAVRLIASAGRRLRERKSTWRINLLGMLNVLSITEFIRDGRHMIDPVSGAFTATDEITARRIRVTTTPLEADAEKLRRVLFESLFVTAAYQASRALGAGVTLSAEQMYLEQHGRTKRRDLEDDYRALIALGLCSPAERDAQLGAGTEFGASTFVIQNRFDSTACDAMFLDADGGPHPQARYERIARLAFLALLPETDPDRSYRRLPLGSDTVWSQVRELGGAIPRALPTHIARHPVKLEMVIGDVVTIMWWAMAMHGAAAELARMRTLLGQRDAATLGGDQVFLAARRALEQKLATVVATTEARFDEPWDVIAMDAAAARRGTLEGVIVSSRFAARYAEAEDTLPAAGPSRSIRGATRGPTEPAAAAGGADAARDWTDAERALFARHVVNLRGGAFSGDGSFSSSREQVTAIFRTHIPAYMAARAGQVPRVLFFAHGGLVEEREGLSHVIQKRRFWEQNGIYPVYFVWETGLKETLIDRILREISPTRDVRGALSDAVIEAAARKAKFIWDDMKRSAELSSAAQGGARVVAGLAAELWQATRGAVELHAVGHSAGAIFHGHFLPLLLSQPAAGAGAIGVRTVSLLAPAIATTLFKSALKPLVGPNAGIASLAMFTMTDDLERVDASMGPYGKSLLYLVSQSFESAAGAPILGLHKSIRVDPELVRFFGLGGREQRADVVFSRTLDTAGLRSRSASITHGGFDNDALTMTSVVRRVLDVSDADPVTDYVEDDVDTVTRAAAVPAADAVAAASPAVRGARRAPARGPRTARKAWTVMVWMAGDNDLEAFGDKDLVELKRVGSTNDVDVVVQFDSMRDDRTRRYHISKGGRPDRDVVQELGETNTGDPVVASDFFTWAIAQYPADRLLAVIWNHGSGIDETDIYTRGTAGLDRNIVRAAMSGRHRRALFSTTVAQATQDRAIAYDDTSRDFLDNIELKKVLATVTRETGRTIDVLGFDACLMSMIEIAFQMRGTVDVIVGSEELEPGDGWPYDRILTSLTAAPATSPTALAIDIVAQYIASYRSGSVTQSAVDMARLDASARAVDTLGKALMKVIGDAVEFTAITRALNATQRFDMADFVDLGHFCAELSARTKTAAVKTAARGVVESLTGPNTLVIAERHKGSGVANATGVAIYFPRGPVNKAYQRLDFAKATSWARFLAKYHSA